MLFYFPRKVFFFFFFLSWDSWLYLTISSLKFLLSLKSYLFLFFHLFLELYKLKMFILLLFEQNRLQVTINPHSINILFKVKLSNPQLFHLFLHFFTFIFSLFFQIFFHSFFSLRFFPIFLFFHFFLAFFTFFSNSDLWLLESILTRLEENRGASNLYPTGCLGQNFEPGLGEDESSKL